MAIGEVAGFSGLEWTRGRVELCSGGEELS